MPYTELLKEKLPAEIEAIQIPAATQGQNNTNIDFTRYAPVPPFILKKFVEDNSSTPQDIIVSRVKALKAFEPTQSVIATLLNAPATTAFQNTGEAITTNKGQAGEQTEAEVADKVENNTITKEGSVGNGQDETQTIALLESFGSHILYWLKLFPEQGLVKPIKLKAITEGSILKTIALQLNIDPVGTLQKHFTQILQPQPQLSLSTQPRSVHNRLMKNQMEIQMETC